MFHKKRRNDFQTTPHCEQILISVMMFSNGFLHYITTELNW